MSPSIYLAVPLMAFLAVLQTVVLPRVPLFGLVPQLPFLVALAWGFLRGLDEGIVWAFIAGLLLDLLSVGPMGTTALAFMAAMLAVLWIEKALPPGRFFIPILLTMLATLIALSVYLLLLRLFGYTIRLEVATGLAPLSLLHGFLILPIYWFMVIIDRTMRPRRVQL